ADDVCTGSSATCPERYAPATTQCRAGGTCDPAEYCTGSSARCPPDSLASDGTRCGGGFVCGRRVCDGGECVNDPRCPPCSGTSFCCECGICISGGADCP